MFILHPQLSNDTIAIGDLPLCQVLLVNERQFPWVLLVPRRAEVTEIYQLEETDRQQLMLESHQISTRLMEHYHGDKLNIGALGNLVSQLHIHHIIRFCSDAAWPKPVWGNFTACPYGKTELDKTVTILRQLLEL